MQNDTNQLPPAPPQTPQPVSSANLEQPKKKRKVWLIVLLVVAVIGTIPLLVMSVGATQKALNVGNEALFYESLSKASQQQKIRIGHAEYRYLSEQDKTANKLDSSLNSIAEFDNTNLNYSTVFMRLAGGTYSLGRCVNGKEYEHKKMFLKTREDAEAQLQSPAVALEKNYSIRSACDFRHVFRSGFLSDGIIPAGFTAQQAQSWIDGMKQSELLEIKDAGSGEYNGKKGRKISFTQNKGDAESFFYVFRDGTSSEVGANTKDFFRFDRVLDNLEDAPHVRGFYLIDEKEKLPFYSEFTTFAAPNQAQFKPLIAKAAYSYGHDFSVTEKTNIELK